MRSLLIIPALVCALALGACGSDDDTDSEAAAGGATTTAAPAGEPQFPQTVEHKFGSTTVEAEPERIVVVGLTEQDVVLELGYQPVATTEWYGEQPSAVWPWAQEQLDTKPTVLNTTDGFQFEKIAELRPDLIIGVNSGMKRADYDKLSQLAPTVPAGKGSTDYFSPWEQQVELISTALGKPEEGERLVREVEDAYATAAAEHPEFKGKVATFSQNAFYSGQLYVYPPGLGTDFLTMLGFEINPRLAPLASKRGEQVAISKERLDVIDADVIVFATEAEKDITELKKVPTFKNLGAVRNGAAVYTDPTLSGAMYFMTPLSLKYVLEKLTPELARAVKGEAPEELVGG